MEPPLPFAPPPCDEARDAPRDNGHDHGHGQSENPRRSRRTSAVTAPGPAPAPDDPLLDFAPVPHKQPRRNSITASRQRAFIAALAASGVVAQAARSIGASLEALYKLRHRPGAEGFAAAWDEAVDRGVRRLEDCALARAIEGEERMVVSAGKVVGTERRHNEGLVMFFLRHRRAERYGKEVRPGHPLYERIRTEVLAAEAAAQPSEQEVIDSINRKIDQMRAREAEVQQMLREEGIGDPYGPDGEALARAGWPFGGGLD